MRLVVFGSRTFGALRNPRKYTQEELIKVTLQRKLMVEKLMEIDYSVLIHGAAIGADTIADSVTNYKIQRLNHKIEVLPFPISKEDWARLGKSAGPFRNRKMISVGRPEKGIGFIDRESKFDRMSPGSNNMYMQLQNNHIPVDLYQ